MGDTLLAQPQPRTDERAEPISGQDSALISSLVAAYFQRVDRPSDRRVADLFASDGRLVLGNLAIEGRDSIAAFFETRNRQQRDEKRVTRHLSGGLEIAASGRDAAAGHSSALVFAGDGDVPLPTALPTTICDFDDLYVRSPTGWVFQERRATVVFTGAGAASFAK